MRMTGPGSNPVPGGQCCLVNLYSPLLSRPFDQTHHSISLVLASLRVLSSLDHFWLSPILTHCSRQATSHVIKLTAAACLSSSGPDTSFIASVKSSTQLFLIHTQLPLLSLVSISIPQSNNPILILGQYQSWQLQVEHLLWVHKFMCVIHGWHIPDADEMHFQMLRKHYLCPHFRILVMGRANAGKTTILEKVCGVARATKTIIYDKDGELVWVVYTL